MIILNFCFKELRFDLYADSVVPVDFLPVLGSIEGGLKVCLVCGGACLSIRVDKVV